MNNNCVITSPTAFAGLLQIISFKAEILNLSEGTAGAFFNHTSNHAFNHSAVT